MSDPAPIRIALALVDAALAERLASALADLSGVVLVDDAEDADVVVTSAARTEPEPMLTPREQQVLALLAEGASNKEIAQALEISVHTAKFHVGQVIDKLDAIGRTDAVAQAARIGVIRL